MNRYEISFVYEDKNAWMYCSVKTESKAKTYFNTQCKECDYKKATLLNIRKMDMT